MAAASPAPSNNSSDIGHTSSAPSPAAAAAASLYRTDTPPKTLRGLNKPKCIQCGNVARSRCPYQSCKSCCFKAQNPCHIHVLKANASLSDKTPASSTPLFDQQSTEVSPAVSSLRAASLRQLSNSFSQFNNVHSPLRSKKPLTKKEAAAINEWRFSKLKEYMERNIEAENEAFDRYMQNIILLEEVFSLKSIFESSNEDGLISSKPDHTSADDDTEKMITEAKLKLRSNPIRRDNVRKRIQEVVDEGLKKLQKREFYDVVGDQNELNKAPKRVKRWVERASALSDLVDNLNKARNEEDIKSILDMKAELYGEQRRPRERESRYLEACGEQTTMNDLAPSKELNFSQKIFRTAEIDQESLDCINAHFFSLEKIDL